MNFKELIDNNLNAYYYEDILNQVSPNEKETCFLYIINKLSEDEKNFYINDYIKLLPDDLKLKYIKLYNFDASFFFNGESFLENISDEEIKYKIACYFLENTSNTYTISNIYIKLTNEYKEKFLYKIKEKEQKIKKNIITSYYLDNFLSDFDYVTKERIVKEVLFKEFMVNYEYPNEKRFNEYNFEEILSLFKDENTTLDNSKMFSMLKFLVEELKKENKTIPFGSDIINLFYQEKYNIKDIINYLLKENIINKFGITGMTRELPNEIKKEVAIFLIEYYKDNTKKIDGHTISLIIQDLNDQDTEEILKKYILEEKLVSISSIMNQMTALRYSNILLNCMTEKEKEENFNTIYEIINFINFEHLTKKEEKYSSLIKIYAEKFNVNENKLTIFIEKFGYNTLNNLINNNFKKYINMDIEEINKLFKIFNDNNFYFDKNIKNDIVNSILQRQFIFVESDTYNIFHHFEECIFTNNYNKFNELINIIRQSIDIDKILEENNINYEDFIKQTKEGYLTILHKITNKYIAYKRERYLQENIKTIDESLNLDKVITREEYKKNYVKEMGILIPDTLRDMDSSLFNQEQLFLINNKKILKEIIKFKTNPQETIISNENKKYIKTFNSILDVLYDNEIDFHRYDPYDPDTIKKYQFEFVQKKVSIEHLLNILLETNYESFKKIINNKELYEKLNEFLSKYKLIGWQQTFNKLLLDADIIFDETTIAGLLANFDKIISEIENKTTLTSILDLSNCYSATSNIYPLLFGKEDYNLIVTNPERNKANMQKSLRLINNAKLIIDMYQRKHITTPTINQEFKLDNGKSINVILGNITNTMNLTYGERTDSCMRQGGGFDDLFKFCIQNENGFHIRFENPTNGNLISRVSGLRNGNTIFLNELRSSLDEAYQNDDLYNCIKLVATHIIEESKKSNIPIENIVITSDYALKDYEKEESSLKLTTTEIIKALNDISFNLNTEAIILATNKPNNELAKYQFDIDLPLYPLERDKIKEYNKNEAPKRIAQLKIINSLLNGIPLEDIDIELPQEEISYLISGEDFYIAIINGKLEIFILDKSKEDIITKKQVSEILKEINLKLQNEPIKGRML